MIQRLGASLVKFKSAALNAITRTLQSKLENLIDVTDFGVVGDGVTDNAVGFAKVEAYVNTLEQVGMYSRKTVIYFPDGDYRTSKPLILWDGVSLRGASQASTKIEMISATNTTGVTTNSPVRNLPRDVNCVVAVFSSVSGYVYRTAISDIQLFGIAGSLGVTEGKVGSAIYAPEVAYLTVNRVRTRYTNYGILSYNMWMCSFFDLDLREHAEWSFALSNDGTGRGGSTSIHIGRAYSNSSEGGFLLYGANYSSMDSCGADNVGKSDQNAADRAGKAPYVFDGCQGMTANSIGAESIYTRSTVLINGGHVTLNEPDFYGAKLDAEGKRVYCIHVTRNGNLNLNGGRWYGTGGKLEFASGTPSELFAIAQTDGVNGSVVCTNSLLADRSLTSDGVTVQNFIYGTRSYRGRTVHQDGGILRPQINTHHVTLSVTTDDMVSSGLDVSKYQVVDAVVQINSSQNTLADAKLRPHVTAIADNSARVWIVNADGSANFTQHTCRVTFFYKTL